MLVTLFKCEKIAVTSEFLLVFTFTTIYYYVCQQMNPLHWIPGVYIDIQIYSIFHIGIFSSLLLLLAVFVCFASFGKVAIKLNAQIDMKNNSTCNEHMN